MQSTRKHDGDVAIHTLDGSKVSHLETFHLEKNNQVKVTFTVPLSISFKKIAALKSTTLLGYKFEVMIFFFMNPLIKLDLVIIFI